MAICFTGLQSAYAQNLSVTWSESESCVCPNLGDYTFRIDVVIVDECDEEWNGFYVDPQFVDEPPAFFPTNYSCIDETPVESCYLIITVVKKICSDGHGGFVVVCSGKNNTWATCHELMYHTIQIEIDVLN